MIKEENMTWDQRKSRERLRCLLRDLGLRSARDKLEVRMAQFSAAMIQNATMHAMSNFGAPDHILMNPKDLESFQKAFGNKKS
jgi:hypothetical protein